jgi:putative endonuclease
MPSSRQISGSNAETLVAEGLEDLGWLVLARNLRTPYAEVDLLCHDPDKTLVVVEVKARSCLSWMEDEDNLGPAQRLRLARAAEWLLQRCPPGRKVRIDLALVELHGQHPVSWRMLEEIEIH